MSNIQYSICLLYFETNKITTATFTLSEYRKFISETQKYTHVPTLKKNCYDSPNILLNDNYVAL